MIKNNTHTPAPWIVETCYNGGRTVATMRSCDHQVCINTPIDLGSTLAPYSNTDANARLIAAAPDLLEACKTAVDMYNYDCNDCGSCTGCMLQAAIDKAEG